MTKEVQQASEILLDLVLGLEPRLKPLEEWFHSLVYTIDKWYTAEGNQGVVRAKNALNQGWLSILGEPTEQLPFVATTDNIPKLVYPLVERVKSLTYDARLLSAVLSLIRVTDLFIGKPQDSTVLKTLDVIQNSRVPNTAKSIIEDFRQFVPQFFAAYPSHPISIKWNRAIHLDDRSVTLYRESKGPNGQLTANAHKDVKTLEGSISSDGISLLQHITELQDQICNKADQSFASSTTFAKTLHSWEGYEDLKVSQYPGKLSLKLEKSGKVRLIAQPDYFSQVTMRPIHDWLSEILRVISSDCTYAQRSAIPKIAEWQSQGYEVSSFDQSSCTDLFPFDMQLAVLQSRFGDPLMESVKTVMSDRDWEIRLPSGLTRTVRWSVGQPLGMYASWPLMALTHHLLVQYCYWTSSGRTFPKKGPFANYVICGDDIVIGSKSVSQCYLKVCKHLGMKINKTKSHISGGQTGVDPVSEFAKIIVWRTQPLFPIRPNMVLSSVKDWRQAVPLFCDLAERSCFKARLAFLRSIVRKHYHKGGRFLDYLLTIPQEIGGVGYRDEQSLKGRFTLIDSTQIHPWLYFIASKVRMGLLKEQKLHVVNEAVFSEVGYHVYREHPYREYLERIDKETAWLRQYDWDQVPSVAEIACQLMDEGFQGWDRFFLEDSTGIVPPTSKTDTEDQRVNRTLWEKALMKRHNFPKSWLKSNEISKRQNVDLFLEFVQSDSDLNLNQIRQYNVTKDLLLASRFK